MVMTVTRWHRTVFIFLVSLLGTPAIAADTCPSPEAAALLKSARQLLLVTTPGWNSHRATLAWLERSAEGAPWNAVRPPLKAAIGRAGLAWGYSERARRSEREPLKAEGDGRTPAGAHRLGVPFGFKRPQKTPYLEIKSTTVCVDDPNSRHYNTVVDSALTPVDWKSAEKMREIEVYKSGFLIDYLSNRSSRAGSCIFAHIWSGPDSGTAGCLAVQEDVIKDLQAKLRPEAHPAVVFLPEEKLASWRTCWTGAASVKTAPHQERRY